MRFFGLIVVSLLFVFAAEVDGIGICENVTATDGGQKVLFFCGRKNATMAEHYCGRLGGSLVTISNEGDQWEVENLMGRIHNECTLYGGASTNLTYIGLSDKENETVWKWASGKPFMYSNWRNISGERRCRQQPNGENQCPGSIIVDQDYAAIQRCSGSNYGLWFDVRGDSELYFVCEVGREQLTPKAISDLKTLPNERRTVFQLNFPPSTTSSTTERSGIAPTTTILGEATLRNAEVGGQRSDDTESQRHGGHELNDIPGTPSAPQSTFLTHYPIRTRTTAKTAPPKNGAVSGRDESERPFVGTERTPPHEDTEVHSSTKLDTQIEMQKEGAKVRSGSDSVEEVASENQQGVTSDDYEDATVSNSVMNRLNCLLLSLQPPKQESGFYSNCATRVFSPTLSSHPVENFELNIAPKAAELVLDSKSRKTLNIKTTGVEMKLVPVTKQSSQRRLNPSDTIALQFGEDCSECDAVRLYRNNLNANEGEVVVVTAALKRDVLEGTGLYSAGLLDSDKFLNPHSYESETFVEKFTSVICVSVYRRNQRGELKKVSAPATTVFDLRNDTSEARIIEGDHQRKLIHVERKCVFLDNKSDGWSWSDYGCQTHEDGPASLRCECNHTTAFAIMVSLKSFRIPVWLEKTIMFVEVIGIFFLTLTLVLLLWLRRTLKKDRVLTQINLTLALLLLHIAMLVAGKAVRVEAMCITLTALSHFFMIASFAWMLNEGLVLYKKTCSKALNFDISRLRMWLLLIGWVFPAAYVILCAGIGIGKKIYLDETEAYEKLAGRESPILPDVRRYQHCWLGTRHRMVLAALIPIAIILCIVIFFLLRVSKVVWTMNIHAQHMRPSDAIAKNGALKATVRAVALLIPILGIPWIFSIFVNVSGAEIVFATLHGLVNGIQGVILFVIYILASRDVRQTTSRRLTQNSAGRSLSMSLTSARISFKRSRTVTSKVDERSSNSRSPVGSPICRETSEAKTT